MSYILIIKYTEIFKLLVLRRVWINSNPHILEDRWNFIYGWLYNQFVQLNKKWFIANPVLKYKSQHKYIQGSTMNQLNFNTKKRNFKHLSEYERGEIYAMIKLGCSISSIARHLKRSRTTIYNVLKRSRVEQIKNGHKVIVYYPDAGQRQYEKNRKNSKKKFKVLECIDFIKFVEKSYLKDQNI